ncbi:hypothetical protein [Amycolatopsis sp. MEPSY49]|uniref:hypothetical protein n=1 Tax=Amycolatopsis sp. MEPSY49 TaxID=3151600 RepID=UPI003EF55078
MPPRSEPPAGDTPGTPASPQDPAATRPTGKRKPPRAQTSRQVPAETPAPPKGEAAGQVGSEPATAESRSAGSRPAGAGSATAPGSAGADPAAAAARPAGADSAPASGSAGADPAAAARPAGTQPTSAAALPAPATSATTHPKNTPTNHPDPTPTWVEDETPKPTIPVTLTALGALALTAAAIAHVSPAAAPGFTSWPWLAVLALAPAVAAAGIAAKRPALANGLILGLAALAPGRLVLDLQFAVNGPLTVRPELYFPDRFIGGSAVGAGFWLLVAGHVLTAAAGIAAARASRNDDEPERRRWRLLAPLLAVTASVGLLTAPVASDNGFLLARAAFEGPWPALGGYLLLAAALPLAAALALAAPSERIARGMLLGLAAGAGSVAVPPILAGLLRKDLHVTWGPVLALAATALVAGLAFTRLSETPKDTERDVTIPGVFWWRLTTGALGLATAVAALVGTFAPQVAVSALNPGATVPSTAAAESPARWFLLTAALLVAVTAALTLVPVTAAKARPVLGVAWAGIVLAGTAVLNTALTATQAGNLAGFGGADAGTTPVFTYDLGAGAAWTFAALVLAALTALAAVGTGVVEREDVGDGTANAGVLTPVVAGAVLAVAGFGLPVFSVPGYVAPGLWSNFDTPSWGLWTTVVVIVGAAGLAVRSRPRPAAALLTGAALLAALHAAELPLVGGTLGGASPSTGFWVTLAAVAALLIAAGLSAAGGRRA